MSLFSWLKKKWKQWNPPSLNPPFNPRPDCLQVIEDKPCVPGEYECYQKSREASKCLKEHGYDAIPTCGPVKGLERHHCWVEIKYDGEIYWYDPTWIGKDTQYGCWKASQYTDREVYKAYSTGKIKKSAEKKS